MLNKVTIRRMGMCIATMILLLAGCGAQDMLVDNEKKKVQENIEMEK